MLAALEPWLAHRRQQGHHITLVTDTRSASNVRTAIRDIATNGHLEHVVLVGDAPHESGDNRTASVPTHLADSNVTVQWGSEPQIATDNWFADLDDDQLPDVSIGRLTADSPEELAVIVRKILQYERSQNMGLWRRRVNLVAGVGGFGALADALLETGAKKFLTDGIPAEFRTSMTYASWRSPYSPDPRLFRHTTIQRLNEGCLAWVYMGHGQRRDLDHVRLPGAALPILSAADVAQLACDQGAPIAVFLSCYAGAFDHPEDCLAEEMLRADGGPVAVVCGSRVTMPYAMAILGTGMLDEIFKQRRATLGEVLLHAKRHLASEDPDRSRRTFVDALATAISPQPDQLSAERLEHVLLFNLIGDPLIRIRQPREVRVTIDEYATAGQQLTVSGTSEVDGPCLVELVCRRDRHTFTPPPRRAFDPSQRSLAEMNAVYQRANDARWNALALQVRDGRFTTQIQIPEKARGPSHVRLFVQGSTDFAMGAADVYVRSPREELKTALTTDDG